ncbi:dTDP-glucose 4,6-dehydratase [Streptomyces albus subsp. albus]|nr:dTDP-glucose 4,6-dehydratase [Streptomyces albus subsp. albus]
MTDRLRIFLAGGTGAVGRRLVPLLVAAGHQVTGVSRRPGGLDLLCSQGAAAVPLDVFDAAAVRRAVAEAAPDVVVHQLTALTEGDRAANARIRAEGTRILVDAARDAGVSRIIAQSLAFAYESGDTPADEHTPLDRAGRPGLADSLLALEGAVAELPGHVVLRYGEFYGPGTWYAPGGPVEALLRGRPGDGPAAGMVAGLAANDAVSSFLHVEDAALAAVAALDWPSGPVNIVDDEPAPAREWLPVLADALGAPAPEPAAGRAGWQRGADNALARSRGWRPRHPSWRGGFATQAG